MINYYYYNFCRTTLPNPTQFFLHILYISFQDDCQNYIRVAYKKNDEELFVCGTNAFHPMCKIFNLTVSLNSYYVPIYVYIDKSFSHITCSQY